MEARDIYFYLFVIISFILLGGVFVANKQAEVALFHITDEQITMIAKMNKLFD